MLEMNLPLQQGTRRSQERESERMLEAAAARKEALSHRLQGDLNAALSNLEGARSTEQISRKPPAAAGRTDFQIGAGRLRETARSISPPCSMPSARFATPNSRCCAPRPARQLRLAEIERLLGEDL